MNAYRARALPLTDIPNLAGYTLTLQDHCGDKHKAVVAVDGRGMHYLTVAGRRVSLKNFIGWESLPAAAQTI